MYAVRGLEFDWYSGLRRVYGGAREAFTVSGNAIAPMPPTSYTRQLGESSLHVAFVIPKTREILH